MKKQVRGKNSFTETSGAHNSPVRLKSQRLFGRRYTNLVSFGKESRCGPPYLIAVCRRKYCRTKIRKCEIIELLF